MKLRNKETGEIRDFNAVIHELNMFGSLAELNKEWEDYEEEKNYWYIDDGSNGIFRMKDTGDVFDDAHREVGNYFSIKEEADEAVEKLKALKRLKDKGFRFVGWRGDNDKHHLDGVAWYEMRLCGGYDIETANDLETIFGPEEKE